MKTVIWLKSAPRTLWARWHYLTLGLLLFAVNCISVFLLLKNQSFTCGPDQVDYLASLFFRISNDIASGGITAGLYSPQFHCGLPHADNPNFHPLYPFYFNWLHADQSIYETIRRLDVIVLIHLAILGTGIGLIARSLSGSWPIAIAAGAVAPYFPAIMSAAQWPQIIASLAWVPFVLLYQIRIAHRPKAYAPAILLGVTASLLIYAQPAQNLVLATVASVIFWLVHFTYLAIGHSKNKIEKLKITLWRLSLSMTIVMTLCGEYLMNLVWFHSLSIRWLGGDLGSVTGNAPVPKAALLEHSMSLVDINYVIVYAIENTKVIGNIFLGPILLLGLAFIAFSSVLRRRPFVIPVLAIGGIAFSFCFSLTVSLISSHLPLVNKVREVGWWSCLGLVAFIPCGLVGVEAATKLAASKFPITILAILLFSTAMATAYLSFCRQAISTLTTLGAISIAVLIFSAWKRKNIHWAIPLCLSSLLFSMVLYTVSPKSKASSRVYSDEYQKILSDAFRVQQLIQPTDVDRIFVDPSYGNYKSLSMALGTLGFRAVHVEGHPLLNEKFQKTFFPDEVTKRALGVRWIIWRDPAHTNDFSIKEIEDPIGLMYLIDSNGKIKKISRVQSISGLLYNAHTVSGEKIIINEDFRANLKIYINGNIAQYGPSDLLQIAISSSLPQHCLIEIIK